AQMAMRCGPVQTLVWVGGQRLQPSAGDAVGARWANALKASPPSARSVDARAVRLRERRVRCAPIEGSEHVPERIVGIRCGISEQAPRDEFQQLPGARRAFERPDGRE